MWQGLAQETICSQATPHGSGGGAGKSAQGAAWPPQHSAATGVRSRAAPPPMAKGEAEAPLAVTCTLGPWDVTARSYPSPSSSGADSGWRLRPTGEGQQRWQICLYPGQVRQGSSMCQLAPPGADGRAPPPQPQP